MASSDTCGEYGVSVAAATREEKKTKEWHHQLNAEPVLSSRPRKKTAAVKPRTAAKRTVPRDGKEIPVHGEEPDKSIHRPVASNEEILERGHPESRTEKGP